MKFKTWKLKITLNEQLILGIDTHRTVNANRTNNFTNMRAQR